MKRLTAKEEEIMGWFWQKGPLFVKALLEYYEEKGFLAHKNFGNSYQYYAVLTEKEYSNGTLKNVIAKYFNNSYLGVVSTLIKEEDISVDDLRKLIDDVEQGNRK